MEPAINSIQYGRDLARNIATSYRETRKGSVCLEMVGKKTKKQTLMECMIQNLFCLPIIILARIETKIYIN